jgi:hypothetical protein
MSSSIRETIDETTCDRFPWVKREKLLLAPYAMFSTDSVGRRYAEPPHTYRGPFQRDRDRILHCSAFRRLSGKMQVFTGEMGDYHRTRLTHTHEVATIARTVGRVLRLNEDLIEALALLPRYRTSSVWTQWRGSSQRKPSGSGRIFAQPVRPDDCRGTGDSL